MDYISNTHLCDWLTGRQMTQWYNETQARTSARIIRKEVHLMPWFLKRELLEAVSVPHRKSLSENGKKSLEME